MADSKITDLLELNATENDDLIVIVDDSEIPKTTKKVKVENLVDNNPSVSQNTNHRGQTDNPHQVTKAQVGLGNADNTSDIDKPVSTAQAQAIQDAINNLIDGAPVTLDTLNELAAAINDDENFATTISTQLANHIADNANPHNVTKAQVGLGNADNTSDVNKPISTAQQAALDLKYNASNPNGYETPAQLNARDVANRSRANHTGTQVAATISDFNDAIKAFFNEEDFLDTAVVNFQGGVAQRKSYTTNVKQPGRYRIAIDVQYNPSNTGDNDVFQLRVNGAQIGLYRAVEPKDVGGDVRDKAYIVGYYNHGSASTFDIQVWAGNENGGPTSINGVLVEVRRVS